MAPWLRLDCLMLRLLYFLPLGLLLVLLFAMACGGERAQDFEVRLFDGERLRLSEEYADNVVVINFWYPSCAPCREEMPEFQESWEELKGEPVRFLGLFVPRGFDNEATAREFVEEFDLTFDFATDHEESIASAYGIEFYPTTWFVDQNGRVTEKFVSTLDAERITRTVRDMLDG